VTLTYEHRRHFPAKRAFHRRQQLRLVVDHHVVLRRVSSLHRIERALFVHIDQHPALHRVPDARALDLARLEDHVAVGENHGQPQRAEVRDRFERARVQTIGERILQHE
jgi:hypothetical protein